MFLSPSRTHSHPGSPARRFMPRALLLLPLLAPGLARAQVPEFASPEAAKLEVTSTSEAANAHFWLAVTDIENIFFERATTHLNEAIEIDPNFGAALAFRAWADAGLTTDQRETEFATALKDLATATPAENLAALSLRELSRGNTKASGILMTTASTLRAGDPHLAYLAAWTSTIGPGSGMRSERIRRMTEVTKRFPDEPPAYNILAYAQWMDGQHDAALETVRRYAQLASDQPNPHDSYAEILQWDGRFEEAAQHYRKATEINPDFFQAYLGLAEALWLSGDKAGARAALDAASEHAPNATARLNALRGIANTFLIEGKGKEGIRRLVAVADQAETEGVQTVATLAHQELAVADAMLEGGRNLNAHLAKAAELGGETPVQKAFTALAYASRKNRYNAAEARVAATELEKAVGEGAARFASLSQAVNAIVLLRDHQTEDALAEIGKGTGTDALTRAVRAECFKKMKRGDEATKIRDGVISDPTLSFTSLITPFAILRARRI